jgi:hypothetical protein
MRTAWRIPIASRATARGLYGEDPAGTFEWIPGVHDVWELSWVPGVKNTHFIATDTLVERKAKMGQLLVRGMPYSRGSLDQEALDRVVSWGYPGSYKEVAAEVQLVNAAYWEQWPQAIRDSYGSYTPEALIGLYVEGVFMEPNPVLDSMLPNRPPAEAVGVAPISSYP